MEFVTTTVQKFTTAYCLHRYKTDTELLIASDCHWLPHKN